LPEQGSLLSEPFLAAFGLDVVRMSVGHHVHEEDGVFLILVARLVFRHSQIGGVTEGFELANWELCKALAGTCKQQCQQHPAPFVCCLFHND